MTQRAQFNPRAALVLLMLGLMVVSQVTAVVHHEQHVSSGHCCVLCHVGCQPLLQAAFTALGAPVLTARWIAPPRDAGSPLETLLPATSSRAPPTA